MRASKAPRIDAAIQNTYVDDPDNGN